MTTLHLLRHAKSSWDSAGLADHDRPLSPRGERAARLMAAHMEEAGISPALVLCSSARRTRDTLAALSSVLAEDAEVQIDAALYGASAAELIDRLRRVDAATPSLLVIGHNPGMQDLAVELAGSGADQAMRQLQTKFPTAALASLDVGDVGWSQLGAGRARLDALVLPRELE